ncbi:phage antirepressor KilAC domain-containing protein [Alicyclobacillus suci]|uniref:phage antirepressor KilAC domain-containing protein n=1 Tax=Alicyclobacillus suci TaxID=2816080 RepID=UPI001F36578A|nr:DNA-binding protein [Alicyclobacillus suci]
MNQFNVVQRNGRFVVDSREVARMTERRHDNLVRDIDGYVAILSHSSNLRADEFFIESTYTAGTGREYRHYYLTRKGCDMVANKMTGEKGVLFTAAYVTKFEEMERAQVAVHQLPQNYKEALIALVAQVEENERLQSENASLGQQIEADKPKVLFAEAVSVSQTSILVRELAVLLRQNGIEIGEKRLFEQLRNKGYLIKRFGTDRNMPTQRSMDLGLFEVKETPIIHSDNRVTVSKTPKVTGRGQIYFINLFKNELASTEVVTQ